MDEEEDLEELHLDKKKPEAAFEFPKRGSMQRRTMVRAMMIRMILVIILIILIKVKEMLTAAVIPLLIFLVFSSCLGCILFTACGEVKLFIFVFGCGVVDVWGGVFDIWDGVFDI